MKHSHCLEILYSAFESVVPTVEKPRNEIDSSNNFFHLRFPIHAEVTT
jgi:hypothetical protein